jgi:cell division protein FtsW
MARRGSPDFWLLIMTIAWVGFGIVMVYSASSAETAFLHKDAMFYTKKQLIAATIGSVLLVLLMNIHFLLWRKLHAVLLAGVAAMLVIVLIASGDAYPRSWLYIGSFSIQPAEFAKLAIVLYVAAMMTKKLPHMHPFHRSLLPILIVIALCTALILLQPDLGSAIVFLCCAVLVLIVGGMRWKHMLIGGLIAVGGVATLIAMVVTSGATNYRVQRFLCYMNPWQDAKGWCWQHVQAEIAFGHGGLFGAGFGQSIQKLFYLPEAQNDFIFAVFGEEFGFVGVVVFIVFYTIFMWRAVIMSLRCSDRFGTLIGIGMIGMLTVQTLINIGGVSRTIPLTGVTLPFFSAGGTSLIVCMASMGILLNVSRYATRAAASRRPIKRKTERR